jgi:hypothetical protein
VNSVPTPERDRPTSAALRRLLIVIGVVIGVVVYAYGVAATDIDLKKTQEPDRQTQVQRALRELLSPRIFTQDVRATDNVAVANFGMGCPKDNAVIKQPVRTSNTPYITISPDCGDSGITLSLVGSGFPANSYINLLWTYPSDAPQIPLIPAGNVENDTSRRAAASTPRCACPDPARAVAIRSTRCRCSRSL